MPEAGCNPENPVRAMVCLTGGQVMPNLIAALQHRPEELICVTTEAVQEQVDQLARAIRAAGLETAIVSKQVDPYDVKQVEEVCRETIARYPNDHLVCNLTGGTKPMSIGMYRAAAVAQVALCYVMTERGLMQWMGADGIREEPIRVRMNCDSLLIASGIESFNEEPLAESRAGADALARQWRTSSTLMQWITKECQGVQAPDLAGHQLRRHKVTGEEDRLLCVLDRLGLIRFDRGAPDPTITLVARYRAFLAGAWLETFVFHRLRDSRLFDDVRHHLRITSKAGVENEVDVLATLNGNAVCISCKTGLLKPIYIDELMARANTLGRYARKVFVTNRPAHTGPLARRAKACQVRCVTGPDLMKITQIVLEELQRPLAETGKV